MPNPENEPDEEVRVKEKATDNEEFQPELNYRQSTFVEGMGSKQGTAVLDFDGAHGEAEVNQRIPRRYIEEGVDYSLYNLLPMMSLSKTQVLGDLS